MVLTIGSWPSKNIFSCLAWCIVTSIILYSCPAYAQTPFPSVFDLNTLDGSNGFVIRGQNQFGKFTRGVGDVNGDGIDDFAIRRTAVEKGEIIFGRTGGYPSLADLQSLGQQNGKAGPQSGGDPTTAGPITADVTVEDTSGGSTDTGSQIRTVSDVNADGARDLVVTQPFAAGGGRAAVIYGSSPATAQSIFPTSVDLNNLTDTEGFFLTDFGASGDIVVASDDASNFLFIGVRAALSDVPVYFLDQSTFSPGSPPPAGVTDASTWGVPGSPGGKITGGNSTALFGHSIDVGPAATSFTGNGNSVLAIGAPADTRFTSTDPGHVYVVFDPGTALTAGSTFDVASLDGTNGFVIEGDANEDELGFDVEFVRDVNGDGIDDLIFGIPGANSDAGLGCVIYGGTGAFPALFHPADLDGTNGTCIGGFSAGDRAGETVFGIADLDSDGFNEVGLGAPNAAPGGLANAGAAYVLDLDNLPAQPAINVSIVISPNGFVSPGLAAGDEFGTDCTSPGDVNGDGAADLSCGAPFVGGPVNSAQGTVYVVCGEAPTVAHTLVAKDDVFTTDEDTSITGSVFADNGNGPDTDSLSHPLEVALANYGSAQGVGTPITIILTDTNNNQPPARFTSLNAGTVQIDTDGGFSFTPSNELDQLGPGDTPVLIDLDYTAIDNNGLQDSASTQIRISGVNDLPTGLPVVRDNFSSNLTGKPIGLGAILTADTSAVVDIEGIDTPTVVINWFSSLAGLIGQGTMLDTGALSPAVRQAMLGGTIFIRYNYTDLGGTPESVDSLPTGFVRNPKLTVNVVGLGTGTVVSSPPGISCPTVCMAEFDFDASVTLTPTAGNGSTVNFPETTFIMDHDIFTAFRFEIINPTPTTVFSAALPSARSGQTAGSPDAPEKGGTAGNGASRPMVAGDPITVFYTAINAGADPAQSCSITIDAGAPVTLSFQPTDATNAPVGTADQPFDMNAGEAKTFILSFTPTAVSTGIEVFPNVVCDNASVSPISGVNGVFLTISDTPVPDVLSIGATVSNDGIIRIATAGGAGFMSASALNIGVGDDGTPADPANPTANAAIMTLSADTGGVTLPLVMGVCALDINGACISPPAASVDLSVANQAATMAVFVTATGTIALDAAINRVFLRLTDSAGITRSVTSAAITAP